MGYYSVIKQESWTLEISGWNGKVFWERSHRSMKINVHTYIWFHDLNTSFAFLICRSQVTRNESLGPKEFKEMV